MRTLALALALSIYGVEVRADPVVLLCSGTMQTVVSGTGYTKKAIQRGLATTDETLSIEVDIAGQTLSLDGDTWPISDSSGTEIKSVAIEGDASFTLLLNRITGGVHFIFQNGSELLRMRQEFNGVCKQGQKLF